MRITQAIQQDKQGRLEQNNGFLRVGCLGCRGIQGRLFGMCKGNSIGRLHVLGVLAAGIVVGGLATDANAQVTKLVPLGPSQDSPSAAAAGTWSSPEPAPAQPIRPPQTISRAEPTRASQSWAQPVSANRPALEARYEEPVTTQWQSAQPQVARRVSHDQPLQASWEEAGSWHDVRQAAYQPSTPADVAPSLNSETPMSGSWQGSPSGAVVTSPQSQPSYSPSPWTSSSGSTIVAPSTSAPLHSSPTTVQRFVNPAPCPPVGAVAPAGMVAPVGVVAPASVPVAQGPVPPLLPITRPPRSLYVSNGLLGQPVIYAPGQPIRNFFRYFTF